MRNINNTCMRKFVSVSTYNIAKFVSVSTYNIAKSYHIIDYANLVASHKGITRDVHIFCAWRQVKKNITNNNGTKYLVCSRFV